MLDPKRGFVCSIALLALLLAAFTAVPAFAQVAGAAITGNVADSTGAVVANAEVTVKNMATDAVRTVSTNDSGFYTAQNLLPGGYSVIISAAGFSTVRRSDLTLSLGMNMVLNVELRVGSVNESIEIKGEAPNVELGTSALGASVRGETIRELPLNGSDWTSLALLEPSVAAVRTQKAVANNNDRANRGLGGFLTVAGARPQQNNYRIDGISINDSANRAPGSVLGVDLGVDSIQEFSVITSNATAEYGKSSGGVINAISRSGTNALHGSVYEFLRNSPLDSRNFFDNHIPPFKRNQFGASAGGQIKKDRTFYFVDYEGLRQIWASPWSVPYPPRAARGGHLVAGDVTVNSKVAQYLGLFPLPNSAENGDFGTYLLSGQQITHEDFFTGRVDHHISERDSLFGTYLFDRGNVTGPDPFNVRSTASFSRRQPATIEESHIFTPTLLNSFSIGYSRPVSEAPKALNAFNPPASDLSLGFSPGRNVGLLNVTGLANSQGGIGATGEYDFHFNSYQAYDDAFYTIGRHSIKVGAAFERIEANQIGIVNPNGQFFFGSLKNFLIGLPDSFNAPISGKISPRDLRQTIGGGYIQDDWRIRPNLTINLGLRYEVSTVPTESQNRLTNLLNLTDASPRLA